MEKPIMKTKHPHPINARWLGICITSIALTGCAIEPLPFNFKEQGKIFQSELESMYAAQEIIKAPISLHQAMARAIKYNLDYRVKLMENALAKGQTEQATLNLLPQLTLDAGYSQRNKFSASSSESTATGVQSLVPSISSEKEGHTASVGMVWNILDFGVNYLQAHQQNDALLIAETQKQKVIQNIVQDVRFAYWRAISAQRLLPKMDKLLGKLHQSLDKLDKLERLNILNPVTYLNKRKQLLNTTREMWQVREQLASAKMQLGALMSLKPGADYRLKDTRSAAYTPPLKMNLSMGALEEYSLANRPELMEEDYNKRINIREIKKAMLRMLPGLEFNIGTNYDSNKYLTHQNWNTFGIRLGWDIFSLFRGPLAIKSAEAQIDVDVARKKALGMAVLTQLHLARLRYNLARKDFNLANQLAIVDAKLFSFNQAGSQANIKAELQVVQSEADTLLSQMDRDLSYAELENAFGSILNSIGLHPLPANIPSHNIEHIAAAIKERFDTWQTQVSAE